MTKNRYDRAPIVPAKRLPWPEFRDRFLAFCKHRRSLMRAARLPEDEEVPIPAEVQREIDEELL